MNAITPGAVVEVATLRGLSPAIVSNVNTDGKITGYLVRANDHLSVVGPYEGELDLVVGTIDGERAAVAGTSEDHEYGVLIYKDADGITVKSIGDRGSRKVRDVSQAVSVAADFLNRLGLTQEADRLLVAREATVAVLSELLEES